METKLLKEIRSDLKKIVRLKVAELVKGKKTKDSIILLNEAGFMPKDIASMLNTTSNNVSVTVSKWKSEKKKKRKRRS